jgi:nucleoporin NUP82
MAASTVSTDCIVTVTAEAAARVWELDRSNKWSFERPALAIDLRKLVDGVSCDQDFEPSSFGKTRGFSVDDFDMEVSAACFGGRGQEDEDGWASMTLWTAMRNGDIYALCPLLPSKWKPTSTTIPSLSIAAVSRMASIAGEDAEMDERRAADQQYEWVQEIDNDEPLLLESMDSLGDFEVRLRPQNPSAIPRLQGPFAIQSEDGAEDIEVSDILVFPARLDEQELLAGEDDYEDLDQFASSGVPFTTICIASPGNELWFAIDLDGVSGQWLPRKGKSVFSVPYSDAKELTLVDNFELEDSDANTATNWPTFTGDVVHNYGLFLTTSRCIYSFSLHEWVMRLAADMAGIEPVDPGLKTRLETCCRSEVCISNRVLAVEDSTEILSAPTVVDDVSLGYLLLSTTFSSAYSVFFDQAHLRASTIEPSSPELTATSPSRLNTQHARK